MHKTKLEEIMEKDLHVSKEQMAKLLGINLVDLSNLLSGDTVIDGDMTLKAYEVKNKYELPRLYSNTVTDILNSNVDLKEKAEKIHAFDYDISARETNGRIPELMHPRNIFINLVNREKAGLDV